MPKMLSFFFFLVEYGDGWICKYWGCKEALLGTGCYAIMVRMKLQDSETKAQLGLVDYSNLQYG